MTWILLFARLKRLDQYNVNASFANAEQANSLVNAALDEAAIGKLGVVVMDELHMIDDESRGYILELMATKLLCLDQNVQLIGMSATLNVRMLPGPNETPANHIECGIARKVAEQCQVLCF